MIAYKYFENAEESKPEMLQFFNMLLYVNPVQWPFQLKLHIHKW